MVEKSEIKIVLADDHEIVRAGIKRLLSFDKSLLIIDEAGNGEDAVNLVKYHKPDIALLDILMPKLDGIQAAEIIKKEVKGVLVVMLTAFEDYIHIEKALTAGADGYLSKDIGSKDLISAIHTVLNGDRVFSKSITKIIQKKYPESNLDASPIAISKREQDVLDLVVAGKTSKEIADTLFLSVRTVESHRYNLMQKLGVKNTASLVHYSVLNRTFLKDD